MIRTTDIALFTLMIVAAAGTYKIKAEANSKQNEIRRIEKQIAYEEDTIDLLEADWSMLTQPERLQKLVEKHAGELSLQPIEAHQVVSVRDVPQRGVAPDDDVIAETIAKMEKEKQKGAAPAKTDETETGSVEE
jgi:hypothetical protein